MLDKLMHLPVVSVDDYEQRIPLTNIVMQKCMFMNTYRLIGRSNVGEGFVMPYLAA